MGNADSKTSLSEAVQFGPCGTDPYSYLSFDEAELPRGLKFSMKFLSREQFEFCERLCHLGQEHLFDDWEDMESNERVVLVNQLMFIDEELKASGGLKRYLTTAQKLLDPSLFKPRRTGLQVMNPVLKGWTPSVPADGQVFEMGTTEHRRLEQKGLPDMGNVGFCVAALHMSDEIDPDTKFPIPQIQLPMEVTTESSYLQCIIEFIKALSRKYARNSEHPDSSKRFLPLCIMTNQETDGPVKVFLEKNDYFGMDEGCITILSRKRGVPTLSDSDAKIALDPADTRVAMLGPRGHGDFHSLLYESGTALRWLEERELKWIYMMEHETNGLGLYSLPLMLGVSKESRLIMNYLAVPRKARDEVLKPVCALKNQRNGLYKNVSIENHELDALLRSKGYAEDGEVNDKKTGFSRFSGNTNCLLFDLSEYLETLEEYQGRLPKFINPRCHKESLANIQQRENENEKSAFGKNANGKGENSVNGTSRQERKSDKKKRVLQDSTAGVDQTNSQEGEDASPAIEFEEPVSVQSRMQDFVHLLTSPDLMERVGFTRVPSAGTAFSPVVRSVSESALGQAREHKKQGFPPYTASTAEADQYALGRKLLVSLGCKVETAKRKVLSGDVHVVPGPAIVLKPDFGCCISELKPKFPNPDKVRISARSTLVVRGEGVVIESLDLDGCLLIDCDHGQTVHVNKVVRNEGWEQRKDISPASNDIYRMRGYSILRKDQETIEVLDSRDSVCNVM